MGRGAERGNGATLADALEKVAGHVLVLLLVDVHPGVQAGELLGGEGVVDALEGRLDLGMRVQDLGAWMLFLGAPALLTAIVGRLVGWW